MAPPTSDPIPFTPTCTPTSIRPPSPDTLQGTFPTLLTHPSSILSASSSASSTSSSSESPPVPALGSSPGSVPSHSLSSVKPTPDLTSPTTSSSSSSSSSTALPPPPSPPTRLPSSPSSSSSPTSPTSSSSSNEQKEDLIHGRRYPIDRSNSSFTSQTSTLSSDSTSTTPSTLPFSSPGSSMKHQRLGLASFLLWLRDHPSSSKVGSENLARFLLVKSVSIMAAIFGCLYGLVFDGASSISAYSLLLFLIPALQAATGATRLCGVLLSMAIGLVFVGLQTRNQPLLGPSLESTLLFGLPLVTGMLVGRRMGLVTSILLISYSVHEYQTRTQNILTQEEAVRLWAGFGAYWLSLLFFGAMMCLYQWCVEVCVKDANLFKDIAVANAKSKDGVVSSVSHELRTPLAALIGWTELLLSDHTLSSSARSTVSMLHSSTLSLLTILNALLDVSKVSAAKMTTCNQNFNLHDLVLDTARMMTGLSGTRSVELLVDFSAEVPELVRADSGLIKQVLGNLVSNAIKFTDVGYVNVGVSLKDEDDDTVTVEFVVQDTGKGIADEQKDKLFVEFSQVEGGKCKTHEVGTGLGLFLVKNLVELMKGHVFMTSQLGVGSTFGFVIRMEKQYLAFRTPGYDHVVTVSSAFQAGMSQTMEPTSHILPVTPGLARSTTPLPMSSDPSVKKATTTTTTTQTSTSVPEESNPPKDYFNLQPAEETRANANNITLRTRDNAFLSNRQYYVHSQCNFFEDFLWKTAAGTWQALGARRLLYEECVHGWEAEAIPEKALAHFGDVYLIDLSPTTNRPKCAIELTDQEHVQQFLEQFALHLIALARERIGSVRQASIVFFYPFGHPPALNQEPFVELASLYQISLCRKPVSERALGTIVKRQIVTVQTKDQLTPPSPVHSWPGPNHFLNPPSGQQRLFSEKSSAQRTGQASESMSDIMADSGRQSSGDSTESGSMGHRQGLVLAGSQPTVESPLSTQPSSSPSASDYTGSNGSSFSAEQSAMGATMDDFKLVLPRLGSNGHKGNSGGTKVGSNDSSLQTKRSSDSEPSSSSSGMATANSANMSSHVRFAKRNGSIPTLSLSNHRVPSVEPMSNGAEKPKSLLKKSSASATSTLPRQSPASVERIQGLNAAGKRVLIVDDNSFNRQLLLQQLKRLGVEQVDQAGSGQEAVDRFEPGVHSLILMDLKMPTMSGFQATCLLRQKEQSQSGEAVPETETQGPSGATLAPRPENDPKGGSPNALARDSMEECLWSPERYIGLTNPFTHQRTSIPSDGAEGAIPSRTRSGSNRATVVAVTADWTAEVGEDREKAINGGFDDVMVKPISLPNLSHLLEQFSEY